MKPQLTFAIILLYLLGLTSCTQSSPNDVDSTFTTISVEDDTQSKPSWNIIQDKTVFIFDDTQNLIRPMKKWGADSVMLSRTMYYHSDSTKRDDDYFGEWIIPSDNLIDTTFIQIDGVDTLTYIREVKVYPISSFVLRR